ncbi:Open rectifier potassium channel protein 1 [Orchesella cincta]|uniref:Open rectifier potassium channel protein 1 n=1 Tax=Orchesella cincta TaxID=48709 RepID=A0A1D2MZY9_ORCCI|nr:Open rectifier potassium channel protein 1 [Orchesella cincta]
MLIRDSLHHGFFMCYKTRKILFRLDYNFYNNETSPDILDALTSAKEGVINRIAAVCGIDNLLDGAGRPEPSSLKWNYYNSVFFAFTVVTTIGYGHLSPSTSLSKSFMMLYALFGIPINGILLSGVGDYFSNKIIKVHQKSKQKQYRGKCTLIFEIIFYLIPGIVVFIIIPSGIFVLIENWTFLDSIYFAFVSLTTIGFGDYVAGMGDGHNIWLWLYKAFIIIWITFGLGYLIMILGFIAKGLKSKKVRGVLEKRLTGIRSTKEKLSKDIDYMRRIVNEMYLMKLKPSYDLNEGQINDIAQADFKGRSRRASCVHFERRCSSLPRIYRDEGSRNVFENFPSGKNPSINSGGNKRMRRLSESDMDRIEFENEFLSSRRHSATQEELLAHVVDTLSGNVMQEVMNAVDELNQYEQQVVDEHYQTEESPNEVSDHERRKSCDIESISDEKPQTDYGTAPPWELECVSESDEEVLLDEDKHGDKLEVVIHKVSMDETDRKGNLGHSFMEKVNGAIRKISGTGMMTPPETPSRKISRNESDTRGKISVGELEKPGPGAFTRSHHLNHSFNAFRRRSSVRRPHFNSNSNTPELEPKYHSKNSHRKPSSDLRKISQESRISNISNSSYRTIDEIISSARASRKTSTAALHHPPYGDEVDSNAKICPEATSLAHLLMALDNVQDRLKKTSSEYGGYPSDQDSVDLSNSFAPSAGAKAINSRYRRSATPPDCVDRRRKVGVFQPGFSYVNFGFNPDGDEQDAANNANKGKQSPDRKEDEFSKSSNLENSTTKKR